ncbi:Uncharacterised protein [Porphyromonas macacae]|uniref:Uncharacterized protein n=2 Tax=Porphyromonas macacae TaxID=28115 RepID=A0A379EAX6_9PORP|nr:Uncharacterised protein [Porphyromonas macacae]
MKIDYKHRGLYSIQDIRNFLFKKSKSKRCWSRIFGCVAVIILLFIPIFKSINRGFYFVGSKSISIDDIELFSSIIASLFTILQWYFQYQASIWNREAREIGNYELTYNLSNRRRIGELIYKELPEVIEKEDIYSLYNEKTKYYDSPKEINSYQETSYRMLENCIWNRYLFSKMYEYKRTIAGFILLLLPLIIICFQDSLSLVFYTVSVISVSSLVFNFVESLLSVKSIISPIETLIKELMSSKIDTVEKFQNVYSAYAHINLKSPNIPNHLYQRHRENLNKTWTEIQKKLPASDVALSIHTVLPIIKNILDTNQIDWAVTGSASEVLRGTKIYCSDIDIIIADSRDIERVNRLFRPFIVEDIIFYPSRTIRSYYGKLSIGGINIDVICDIENLISSNCWVPHPTLEIEKIWFYGVKYPTTSLGFERKVENILVKKEFEQSF